MSKFNSLTILAIALLLNLAIVCSSPASASEETENDAGTVNATVEIDSMCDCDDGEALYHKIVRQFMDKHGPQGLDKFKKEFKLKKVCGSDGKKYNSGCELQCERLKNPESDLVQTKCGRRPNKSHKFSKKQSRKGFKSAALKLEEPSSTEKSSHPHHNPCICHRHYFPVCASNGETYGNMCVFKCAQETTDPGITVIQNGTCAEKDEATP